MRYIYLGDKLSDEKLRGMQCDPVKNAREKCVVGRKMATALVIDEHGQKQVVLRRRLVVNRKAIVARYRKVSWGRLLWKKSNPRMRVFDRDDVCVVRNGTVTVHYKTLDALLDDISLMEKK